MRYSLILIFLIGCSSVKTEAPGKEYNAASSSDNIDMEQILKDGDQNLEKISELIRRLESNN